VITRLLIANRGEIARRVARTCRDLGVAPVAVYSDADAAAAHVADADAAVRLPGNAPSETYLRADLLLDAAKTTAADAVHPGYGFLSENAPFARAVIDAGLTWVGPPPEAIEAMGSKVTAKKLMADAGVPVLAELDPSAVAAEDLPLLVKASAGGGGRGMRIVRSLEELDSAVESARREAASAFGDPTVFCEPYVEAGRHIEVQILADAHGTVWALGERECSIQRRHQKVVEETPSPAVSEALRHDLCDAAVKAARAIGYVGAGTVEFLLGTDGRFHFLEVNTRLQVEHPVTECVYGLDLVALQLSIAEGQPLAPEPPEPRGHAIEVRLYAEDPSHDWRPQTGTVHRFAVPGVSAAFTVPAAYGVRLDSGVEDGSVVGVHYDPMLAKVIAWGATRADAARRLSAALAGAKLHGVVTNRDLLVRVLRHPAFVAGETDTAFFDRHGLDALAALLADPTAVRWAALAAALAGAARRRAEAPVLRGLPSGWRNNPSQPQRISYETAAGDRAELSYTLGRSGLSATAAGGGDSVASDLDAQVIDATPDAVVLTVNGARTSFSVHAVGDTSFVDSVAGSVTLTEVPRFPDPSSQVEAGSLLTPMPGTVVRLHVTEGEHVEAGQPLLVLEAMKMEHPVVAPHDGVVATLRVEEGSQVEGGAVLAVITPLDEGALHGAVAE